MVVRELGVLDVLDFLGMETTCYVYLKIEDDETCNGLHAMVVSA